MLGSLAIRTKTSSWPWCSWCYRSGAERQSWRLPVSAHSGVEVSVVSCSGWVISKIKYPPAALKIGSQEDEKLKIYFMWPNISFMHHPNLFWSVLAIMLSLFLSLFHPAKHNLYPVLHRVRGRHSTYAAKILRTKFTRNIRELSTWQCNTDCYFLGMSWCWAAGN